MVLHTLPVNHSPTVNKVVCYLRSGSRLEAEQEQGPQVDLGVEDDEGRVVSLYAPIGCIGYACVGRRATPQRHATSFPSSMYLHKHSQSSQVS